MDEQQNFVHVHVTCQKCGGCIYECEHRVKTTLVTTASDDNIGATVTPPQHSYEWIDEVLDGYGRWMVDTVTESYKLPHPDIQPAIGIAKRAIPPSEAKAAILAELKKREAAARIDELRLLWPKFTDIKSDGTNGLENNPTARRYIDDRLAQLHKEQPKENK